MHHRSSTTISYTTLTGNTACRGAGVAALDNANVYITNSTISGNDANKRGGGLYINLNTKVFLTFNTIAFNPATNEAPPSSSSRPGAPGKTSGATLSVILRLDRPH